MYCIKCGKKNIAGYRYCYNCGAALYAPPPAETNPVPVENAIPEQPVPAGAPDVTRGEVAPLAPSPNPPGYSPPPVPSNQGYNPPPGNWPPPYYSRPNFPVPGRKEPMRYTVAPSGKPVVVQEHPGAFYAYRNAEKKQVYAAYAPLASRMLAALIDTMLVYLPLQFLTWLIIVLTDQDIQRRILAASDSSAAQSELNNDIISRIPGWVSLLILTIYLLYCVLMTWKAGGATAGKKLLRMKIISRKGGAPDFQAALTRNLFGYSYGLGSLFLLYGTFGTVLGFCLQLMVGLGFAAAFFDAERRGWHDRLAGTLVVGKNEIVQGVNY